MSIIPKTVHPDLQKERYNASFDVEEFAMWWHGGEEKLKFKRFLESYVLDDLDENAFRFQNLSHEDIYNSAVNDFIRLATKLRELQEKLKPGGTDIWPAYHSEPEVWGAIPAGNMFSVHLEMVVDCIRQQGTDEQFQKFGVPSQKLQIGGAYAQTELGHGTFVRGLETRADFDRDTDEFVLNTPTITAYKWWPGGLGHSANYCIVAANLYIDNEPKGLAMFMVPLRDMETHMPLPGIDVGDIGKRMGFAGVNNGFLGLKDVRIPRTNMLMRHSQVHRDGTFVQSPVPVLTYFTMVFVRCLIVRNMSTLLSIAATIATRYSAVRRQSPINPNDPEPQIIDHVTQQKKLFPEIANSIAYKLATTEVKKLYGQTSEDIKRGEFGRLPEMHALSCILKVLCTTASMTGIETLRLACGGHGYLVSSNMSNLYADAAASCTYEGENTVLLLQVGRFLMKSYPRAMAGKELVPTVAYLSEAIKHRTIEKWTGSWQDIIKALQISAANKISIAYENLTARRKAGQTEGEAANNTGIELTQAAELHGICFVVSTFFEEVKGPNSEKRSPALNKVLEDLLELFLVSTALKYMHEILRVIELSDDNLRSLQERLENVLKFVRLNAVAICDGFDYHDKTLKSTLGCYDGNVYERIFEEAKRSPLNKKPVPEVIHTHLKPFMKSNL
ncbi:probable peroxisomal acyl-coenzyme A oxidase 1 [Stomoxys calcitrans]|uniref:probable peroxisomal acyl-coenzyme A oxidase 1 n=1 Tax=Stomoxys calcitrans TaxID=35570 RepID=UPI0027E2E81F|nr:probable peroxisomal acyl-coenzyme A oxidase 1 [Stomoxys calcitrans]